jgi:hypothetical protein
VILAYFHVHVHLSPGTVCVSLSSPYDSKFITLPLVAAPQNLLIFEKISSGWNFSMLAFFLLLKRASRKAYFNSNVAATIAAPAVILIGYVLIIDLMMASRISNLASSVCSCNIVVSMS